MRILTSALWLVTFALAVVAILPTADTGLWWIRAFDAARLQFVALLAIPLLVLVCCWLKSGSRRQYWWPLAILLATAAWQLKHVVPYTPVWPVEVKSTDSANDQPVTILIANIKFDNPNHAQLIELIHEANADVVLLIEVNERWQQALLPLNENYEFTIPVVRADGLGMLLLSRWPLSNTRVEHLISKKRPTIFTTVTTPSGKRFACAGTHPTPPGLEDRIKNNDKPEHSRRDSRVRDAELVLLAREIRDRPELPWIDTGDFNDVVWSDTTKLFKELSGLLDPRVGRSLLPTYHSQRWYQRIPIDHVFVSSVFHYQRMERLRVVGSDHFAMLTRFSLGDNEDSTTNVTAEQANAAEDMVEEGREDVRKREVQAEP